MRPFALAIVAAVALAAAAGFLLEGWFAREAADAFSTEGARVGEDGSIERRGFDLPDPSRPPPAPPEGG